MERFAVVTGTNKGIGLAISTRLATSGFTAYLGSRDPDRGQHAARDFSAQRLRVRPRRWTSPTRTAWSTRPPPSPSRTTGSTMAETYDVNVFGVVRVTNAVLSLLRRAPAVRIVNVTSTLGSLRHLAEDDHPMGRFPLTLADSSSKRALNAVTLAYAKELADTTILVDATSSGHVTGPRHRATSPPRSTAATAGSRPRRPAPGADRNTAG